MEEKNQAARSSESAPGQPRRGAHAAPVRTEAEGREKLQPGACAGSAPDSGKKRAAKRPAPAGNKKKGTGALLGLLGILLLAAILLGILLPRGVFGGGSAGTDKPGAELEGSWEIVVWVPEPALDLTRQQIEAFNSENTDGIRFLARVEPLSEVQAAARMLSEASSGADLYLFMQDQLPRLVQAGALTELEESGAATLRASHDPGALRAVSYGERIYAYPVSFDNVLVLYYDKSVIPEADLDSLEALIADCERSGKDFAFEAQTSSRYLVSWFFGAGCSSEWSTDDKGQFVSVQDSFDSPEGLIAAKGMKKLLDSPAHLSSSRTSRFASGAAIVVSDLRGEAEAREILGDNFGCAELPSFTAEGKSCHLASYSSDRLLGIKPQTDPARAAALRQLALYLSGEEASLRRFEALSWLPTQLAAQASPAIQSDPTLAALTRQAAFAQPQRPVISSWWEIARAIGDEVKAAADEKGLQAALDHYASRVDALLSRSSEGLQAWTVIGSICGTYWDTDFPMDRTDGNSFVSVELEFHAGDEFKLRRGASWDVNFGADGRRDGPNVTVPEAGIYVVRLTLISEEEARIELEKRSGLEEAAGMTPEASATAEVPGWSLIGTVCGTNWDTDFPMTRSEDAEFDTFVSEALELKAGEKFKIRRNGSWDVNFGADGRNGQDILVPADGRWIVRFVPLSVTILMENADTGEMVVTIDGVAAWGVAGSFNGWGETADLPMSDEDGDNIYESAPLQLLAGDKLKCRLNGDWTLNYGADGQDGADVTVEADGTYIVVLDLNTGTVTLRSAE